VRAWCYVGKRLDTSSAALLALPWFRQGLVFVVDIFIAKVSERGIQTAIAFPSVFCLVLPSRLYVWAVVLWVKPAITL